MLRLLLIMRVLISNRRVNILLFLRDAGNIWRMLTLNLLGLASSGRV
jgi:hypothetical protein